MVGTIVGGIGLGLVLIVLTDIVLMAGLRKVCNGAECQNLFWYTPDCDESSQVEFEDSDFDKLAQDEFEDSDFGKLAQDEFEDTDFGKMFK